MLEDTRFTTRVAIQPLIAVKPHPGYAPNALNVVYLVTCATCQEEKMTSLTLRPSGLNADTRA